MKTKVAAQVGQKVTLVDIKPELLENAQKSIQTNLQRVARKTFKDDPQKMEQFVKDAIARITVIMIKTLFVIQYMYSIMNIKL